MFVYINDKKFDAKTGEHLIDIARKNNTHIGYFCGGNAICQTCYVKVTEGMHLLSPLNDREKAMLSDKLIEEGIRVACLTTLDKLGTVKLVTAVEEVKQLFNKEPVQLLFNYPAKMGWESFVKFGDTIGMQAERLFQGKLDLFQLFRDVMDAITDAIRLAVIGIDQDKTFETPIPHTDEQKQPVSANSRVQNACSCRELQKSEKCKTPSILSTHTPASVN